MARGRQLRARQILQPYRDCSWAKRDFVERSYVYPKTSLANWVAIGSLVKVFVALCDFVHKT